MTKRFVLLHFLFIAAACSIGYSQPATRPAAPAFAPGVRLLPNIEFARPEGRSLLLDLYLPENSDPQHPIPLIVYVHGGGWAGGDRHDRTAVPLVTHGYAVASIEYRLTDVAKFPAQIEDCKAAVRWLRSKAKLYNLDGTHVGAFGPSAGGHLVALMGTAGEVKELEGTEGNLDYSSRVQAVCDFFGPTDLTVITEQFKAMPVKSVLDHEAPDSFAGRLLGGPISQNKDKARAANPITYITKDCPPFLIMHGDHDQLVPVGQSEILRDALQKAGVEATLVIVPNAGHGFGGPKVQQTVLDFFDTHLKNSGPATQTPAK